MALIITLVVIAVVVLLIVFWLFGVYLVLYAGFVGLNAFAPAVMARTPFGGLNLAILYGLGLIVAAFVLALIYMALCRRIVSRHGAGGRDR